MSSVEEITAEDKNVVENVEPKPEEADLSQSALQNDSVDNKEDEPKSQDSGDGGGEDGGVKMSKNQLKKLKRLEKMTKYRPEKRKKERELRRTKGKINLCIKESQNGEIVQITRKSLKKNLMVNSSNKLRIVIDCSFEHLMHDSDISHLGKQLSYCYARNRRTESPLQLYITSCQNKLNSLLQKSGLVNWDIHLHEKYYLQVFDQEPKENICYLTSDSPNEIDDFDDKKVYVIGGFVDHNHHKSYCYNLALKQGLSHARLPIGKFLKMKTRKVLTVNQVFEIISRYSETKDWEKAFIATLPKRKGAQSKQEDNESDNDESPATNDNTLSNEQVVDQVKDEPQKDQLTE